MAHHGQKLALGVAGSLGGFLGLVQFRLGALPFRDIDQASFDQLGRLPAVGNQGGVLQHPHRSSVLSPQAVFEIGQQAQLAQAGGEFQPGLGVEIQLPGLPALQLRGGRETEDACAGFVAVQDLPVQAGTINPGEVALEKKTVAYLALSQRLFRSFVFGDVAGDSRRTDHVPGCILDGRNREGDIDPAAVLAHSHGLKTGGLLAPLEPGQNRRRFVHALGGRKDGDGLSHHLCGPIAVNQFCALVPTGNHSFQGHADNAIVGRFHDSRQLRTRFLGPGTLGDVSKSPDPPDVLSIDSLRFGVSFEDPSVLEFNPVVTFPVRMGEEFGRLQMERLRGPQLGRHAGNHLIVIPGGKQRLRNSPQLRELRIKGDYLSSFIDHQDSIRGGLQGRSNRLGLVRYAPPEQGDPNQHRKHDQSRETQQGRRAPKRPPGSLLNDHHIFRSPQEKTEAYGRPALIHTHLAYPGQPHQAANSEVGERVHSRLLDFRQEVNVVRADRKGVQARLRAQGQQSSLDLNQLRVIGAGKCLLRRHGGCRGRRAASNLSENRIFQDGAVVAHRGKSHHIDPIPGPQRHHLARSDFHTLLSVADENRLPQPLQSDGSLNPHALAERSLGTKSQNNVNGAQRNREKVSRCGLFHHQVVKARDHQGGTDELVLGIVDAAGHSPDSHRGSHQIFRGKLWRQHIDRKLHQPRGKLQEYASLLRACRHDDAFHFHELAILRSRRKLLSRHLAGRGQGSFTQDPDLRILNLRGEVSRPRFADNFHEFSRSQIERLTGWVDVDAAGRILHE